jgi:hypothetical protein
VEIAVDHLFHEGQLLPVWGFLRGAFWCRHCSIAGPTVTWPKLRPQSTG